MDIRFFIQLVVAGILTGGVYGLSALGLSLVWGVMKVVNAAHGDLIMLGAFLSYELFINLGLNPIQSLLIVPPVGAVLGAITYAISVRRLVLARELPPELMTLVMTFGLATAIYGSAAYRWGLDIRGIPFVLPSFMIGHIIIPLSRLLTFILAASFTLILLLFLKKTYTGKAIRALAQNRDAAMVIGINPDELYLLTFMISFLYAFAAGVMVSIVSPGLVPYMGAYYIGKAFAVVVLGGLGNPVGAMVGGVILGVVEAVATPYVTYGFIPAISLGLLILLLIFKPTGLFAPMR